MKRKFLLLSLCCGLVGLFSLNLLTVFPYVSLADVALGDGPRPIDYGSLSTQRPLPKNETVFVTDVGGDLDQYLYRHNLQATGGRLTFAWMARHDPTSRGSPRPTPRCAPAGLPVHCLWMRQHESRALVCHALYCLSRSYLHNRFAL